MEFNATFLVSIVSFLLFVGIMNKIFYAPLTNVMTERKDLLDTNYSDAKRFDDDAQAILKDRDERLGEAETKSRKIISDRIEDENSKGKALTDEASKKSAEDIKSRKAALEQEKEAAAPVLNSQVIGLAESIASKVMGMDVKIPETVSLNGVK